MYSYRQRVLAAQKAHRLEVMLHLITLMILTYFLLALAGNRSTSSSVLMSNSWSKSTPRYVNLRKVRGFFAASSAILASSWCYSVLTCLPLLLHCLPHLEGGSGDGQGIMTPQLPHRRSQLLQTSLEHVLELEWT